MMVIFSMRVDVTVTIVTSSFPQQPRCYNWLPSPKSPKAESTIIPTYRTRVNPSQGVRILICSKTSLWIGKFTLWTYTFLWTYSTVLIINEPLVERIYFISAAKILRILFTVWQHMVCLPHFFNYFCIFRWTTGFFFESAVNVPF